MVSHAAQVPVLRLGFAPKIVARKIAANQLNIGCCEPWSLLCVMRWNGGGGTGFRGVLANWGAGDGGMLGSTFLNVCFLNFRYRRTPCFMATLCN